ncbi:MAG TPA: methionyl-tRNA formyltransferase [Planctomycetaceae bacterium]|nr:methionyl-tRNA formyltransferase [Planctomycetaceae bacterium]
MPLKIVLMGTGDFAVPTFRELLNSEHTVVGVLTQPDKVGRGHHQHLNPVKELALAKAVPVFQPERVNRSEMLDTLRSLQADVFIVAAYGQILKPELLAIPRLGAFNLHGSLLPRHRGAAPVQYAIWKGDSITGVTVFRIEPSLDSGPMVGRVETPIGDIEKSGELMLRLAELSVPLTLNVVRQLEAGTAVFERQDSTFVTLSPKILREAGVIDWSQSSREIDCHIRAMQPWPKASSVLHRHDQPPLRCIVSQVSHVADESLSAGHETPGALLEHHSRLLVRSGDGWLEILKLQPEGRKATDGRSFINGYSLKKGDRFAAAE